MKESILKEKAMDFAIRIVNLYHFLNDKKQEKKLRKAVGEARQMCYNILQIYYLQ